ncbi:hypothetical protein MRX96_041672 [Rhipicephalus microplus]
MCVSVSIMRSHKLLREDLALSKLTCMNARRNNPPRSHPTALPSPLRAAIVHARLSLATFFSSNGHPGKPVGGSSRLKPDPAAGRATDRCVTHSYGTCSPPHDPRPHTSCRRPLSGPLRRGTNFFRAHKTRKRCMWARVGLPMQAPSSTRPITAERP